MSVCILQGFLYLIRMLSGRRGTETLVELKYLLVLPEDREKTWDAI